MVTLCINLYGQAVHEDKENAYSVTVPSWLGVKIENKNQFGEHSHRWTASTLE